MTHPSAVECTPFPDLNLMDVEPSEKLPIIDLSSPIWKDAVVPSENATSYPASTVLLMKSLSGDSTVTEPSENLENLNPSPVSVVLNGVSTSSRIVFSEKTISAVSFCATTTSSRASSTIMASYRSSLSNSMNVVDWIVADSMVSTFSESIDNTTVSVNGSLEKSMIVVESSSEAAKICPFVTVVGIPGPTRTSPKESACSTSSLGPYKGVKLTSKLLTSGGTTTIRMSLPPSEGSFCEGRI